MHSARGRANGAIWSVADRRPVGKDPALAPPATAATTGGRPPAPDRKVLEGILWILRSGARWQDLPEEFPSPSTCWRRLRELGGARGLAGDLAGVSGRVE